ncbi:SsgA family sporulation/cell division regulator [Streptomyces sp. NPDC058701]|uniref:SsgA family sporulation/cell division regulator n=1 Tax=Streptomyces sp. NPDC058701 TaxID=3346608 RepID=UPI003647BD59
MERNDKRRSAARNHVEIHLLLTWWISDERRFPIIVRFSYCVEDPFAAVIEFMPQGFPGACWRVARELLDVECGVSGPGDVQAWAGDGNGGERTVFLCVVSAGRSALFEAPRAPLRAWLASTYDLVPAGTEGERIDWDGLLEQLLG